MRIRASSIIGVIIGVFAIMSSLSNVIMPVVAVRQALAILVIFLTGYKLLKRPIKAKNRLYILLVIVMIGYIVFGTSWNVTDSLLYGAMLLLCLASENNIKWTSHALKIARYGYVFYAMATVFLYFNRDIYMTYIVPLFPDTASRLVKWYNSGYMAGITNHYSTNAMLLTVGVLIYGTQFLSELHLKSMELKKKQHFLVMLFFVVCLLLTAKRAHIIFSVAALFCVYSLSLGKQRISNRFIKTIGVILGVLVLGNVILSAVPALSGFVYRFQNTINSGDVSMGRYVLWKYAIDAFKRHWIFGIGWKAYASKISLAYNGFKVYDTHNIYLQILAETGIVGGVTYLVWFLSFLVSTIKQFKIAVNSENFDAQKQLSFSLGFQVFFLLYGLTGNPLYDEEMYIPYYISCAITMYYNSNNLQYIKGEKEHIV